MRPARGVIAASIASIFSGRSASRPPQPATRRLAFESLESRILLSADPAAAGALVVIDGSLGELADQWSGSDVLVLDQDRDALEQITAALGERPGEVSALHIVSHGWNGSLALGGTALDAASLESHAARLRAWADQLTADADILFYGCNLAADEAGMQFVQQLSDLTGADIAASTDLTGAQGLGGDWELEYATGSIEAGALAAAGDVLLATIDYDASTDTLTFTADAGQADALIISSPGTDQLRIQVANGDTIVLGAGATGPAFTLDATNTLLTVDRAAAPVLSFGVSLGDQDDTVRLENNQPGLGAVSIGGEVGNDAVIFLNSALLAGNLTLGVETVLVGSGVTIDVGSSVIDASSALVSITGAGGATINAASFSANSLVISTGVVNVNADTAVTGTFTLSSGTLAGTGDVTAGGLTTWSGGTMSGSGDTNTNGGLNINGTGVKTLAAGRTLNTAGTTTWSGSTADFNGEISLSGGSVINNSGTWNDNNAFVVRINNSGAGNEFNNNGTYNRNAATGETQINVGFDNAGAVNVNAGRVALGGGGTSSGSFNGVGSLELSGGTHTLTAASSITTGGATFSNDFSSGTFSLNGTYDISDSGTTQVTGNTVTFNAAAADLGSTLLVSGGTANIGTTSDTLTTLTVNGSGTLTSNGTLTVSGTTTLSGSGLIQGSGTLNANGPFVWSSGDMGGTGTTNVAANLDINSGAQKRLEGGRTLNTAGTTTWSGSTGTNTNEIVVTGGSDIVNSGTWNDQNTHVVRLLGSTGGGSFTNNGTYTRSGSAGETQITVAFNNANVVNVTAGRLVLGGGGTSSGSFSGAGTLELSGGTHTLTAASSITTGGATFSSDTNNGTFTLNGTYDIADAGTTQVTGSTVNFNAPAADLGATLLVSGGTANIGTTSDTLTTLTVNGSGTLTSNSTLTVSGTTTLAGSGTIQGSGTLNANGPFVWSAGEMGGTGTTNVAGNLDINTAGQKQLAGGRTLNTAGTTTWSGSTSNNNGEILVSGSASINNSGTWNDENTFIVRMSSSGATGSFTNNGTYNRNGATGETDINIRFNNASAVNINAGRLVLGGGGTHTGSFATAVGTTLEFSGGTHNLNNASAVDSDGRLLVSGGTVNTTGTLTSGGLLQLTNGTLNAGGTVDATTYSQSGGILTGVGTLTISGLATWSAGTMSGTGTTNANGDLNINTLAQKRLEGGRTLNTAALTTWSGSTAGSTNEIIVQDGSTINNSGTWSDQNQHSVRMLSNGGTGNAFNNTGTYTRSGTAGETVISATFNNHGVLNANGGTVSLDGGGASSGAFNLAGGTLEFGGGVHNLQAASSVSGPGGTVRFDAGTVTLAGAYDVTGMTVVAGAIANFTGMVDAVGALAISNGNANFSSGELVQASTLSLTGGTLSGSDTVSVTGLSTWSSGTMTGTGATTTGDLNINTANQKRLEGGRTLSTAGTTTWSGSTANSTNELVVQGGSVINNSGTWNDDNAHAVRLLSNGGANVFNNSGIYNRNALAGETQISIGFNNAGAANVNGGTLALFASGTHTGSFATALGTTLDFRNGTHALDNASAVDSDGRLLISGATLITSGTLTTGGLLEMTAGTLDAGGTVDATTYRQAGGTLTGTGTVNISGLATWSAGTMSGTGITNANGDLNINTVNQKRLESGRTLNTAGTTTWSGSTINNTNEIIVQGDSVINNSGTWNDQNAHVVRMLSNGGTNAFNNDGTYVRSAATGETQISMGFDNSGALDIQGGTVNFFSSVAQTGTIDVASGATLRKGTGGLNNDGGMISGSGTIDLNTGTLTSSGTIRPGGLLSAGVLTLEGSLALTGGSVDFDLAGSALFDAIHITGSATLSGDANISHLGGFVPTEADGFLVILITPSASGDVTGTFTAVNSPGAFDYDVAYGADDVTFHLAANEPPVAVDDTYTTAEDTPLVVGMPGVLFNDSDPDLDSLTAILETDALHGTVTLNADGSFTYTPDLNFNGGDSFTYRASDGPLSDVATVFLTVSAVNDAPVANDDTFNVNEDIATLLAVRANDVDVDGNLLSITSVTQGVNGGAVVINTNGTVTYTSALNYFGLDSFSYTISDGQGESDTATVTVNVAPVADYSIDFLTPASALDEDDGPAVLTLVLTTDTPLNNAVLVDLTAPGAGSATLGADYSFTNPTTVTFAAGSATGATRTANVTIANDRFVETIVETAQFDFGNVRALGLGVNAGATTGSHTVSITDNDSASVSITAPGTTIVTEGGASADVELTLDLVTDGTGAEQLEVEISATLAGNADYAAMAAVFGAGAADGATANVAITAVNDRGVEQASETFTGQLLSATSAAAVSASGSQTIQVLDNDSATVSITAPGTTGVTEGGASADVGVTLFLTTTGTGTEQLDVEVSASLPGNADYSAAAALFGVGALHGAAADVVVTAVNDRRVEQEVESFGGQALGVTSIASVSVSGSQSIEVLDNDSASVAITAPGTSTLTEGGASANVGVTLTLNTDGTGAEELDVAVSASLPGNADYSATAAVFGPGAVTGATADVTVTAVNDRRVEAMTESFAPQALTASGSANVSASTSQTIEVADNDSASVALTTPGTTGVEEGDASAAIGVTLSLTTDGTGSEELDVEVSATLAGNDDYSASAALFGAGTVDGATADVLVTALNDRRVERMVESFAAQLLGVTSAATVAASGSQTIEVTDNDSASVAITSPGTTTVTEGGAPADVEVTLDLITDGTGTEQLDVEVSATLPGNSDYAASAAVFAAGSLDGASADVSVAALDELVVEQAAESFAGQALSAASAAAVSASTSQTIEVLDNDTAVYTIDDVTVSEAAGTLTFTILVSNPVDVAVAIDVSYADQTATGTPGAAGADYDNSQDQVVFAPLDTAAKTVTVAITDDDLVEAAETFLASLSTATALGTRSVDLGDTAIGTIANDDANGTPDALDDSYTTDEDVALTVAAPGVLANDTDADGNPLTAELVTGPAHGTLVFNSNGGFTYTPDANYNGGDSFTYRASDGSLSDVATVSLTINSVNDGPDALDDSATTNEDAAVTIAVRDNDVDVDGDALAVASVTQGAEGAVAINADGTVTYTPGLDFFGTDTFTYTVSDGQGGSDTATVTVTVNAVNDAPVAGNDAYATNEDVALTIAAPGVLANDADVDSALTAVLVTGPANGTLTLGSDGSFTYTPDPDFFGTDGFTYRADDGDLDDTASVTITVNAVNDGPDAQDDAYSVLEDGLLAVDFGGGVLANDHDVDSLLTAELVDDVDHGTLTLGADGSFLYAPDLNFSGTDTFIYRVFDGEFEDTATVTITVEAVNDNPAAAADAYATAEDTALVVTPPGVLGNDADVDGDALSVSTFGQGSHGTVSMNADGSFTYTPDLNFHGTDTFEYTVSDGEDIDTGLVTVTVTPVNDAPVAVDDAYSTDEGVTLTIGMPGILGNDIDVDEDMLTATLLTGPAHGTLTLNPDGSFTYTPDAGFSDEDSFQYTLSDGNGGSDVGRVTITVNEADDNDAPEFVEVDDQAITEGVELRFFVVANDADHPAGALVYSAADLPTGATFDPTTREFVWLPADEEIATVTFTVLDPEGASDTMEVQLTASNVAATVDAGANQVVGLQKVHHDRDEHDDDAHRHKNKEAAVSISAAFNDLGTLDTHSARIDWGDGHVTDGTVSESPFGPPGSSAGADGTVTGSHTYTKAGVYTVKVTVTDDDGASRTDTLTITVKDPDKHLKAHNDRYELREDAVLVVNAAHGVLDNDRGGPGTLQARLVEGPQHGELTFNADGSFTYRPDADFHGKDTFWYEFSDGSNVSKAVKVDLVVRDDGRRDACVDWGGHPGWGHGHGGAKQANFAEFLVKLARKFG